LCVYICPTFSYSHYAFLFIQLTIGEDGQIVVDEQSLIIENQEEPTEYVDVVSYLPSPGVF